MADATNVLAEGEVQQLMNVNDPDTTEESYMRVIYSKTARLFEVAAQSVAIVAGAEKSIETAFQEYGRYLGTAFQLVDDVLDYSANAAALGKNVGDDLAEGKPTLPLLHAMRHGNPQQAALIREAIEQGGKRDAIDDVLAIMTEHKSLDYAMDRAKQVRTLQRGFAWLDTGTHDSLSEASTFIEVIEKRQIGRASCRERV